MAQVELIMPKMGESVAEATIIKWLKEEGDTVEAEEPILEIATDKVDSEVPAPSDGVLSKKLYEEDDVVKVGEAVALIEAEAGEQEEAPAIDTKSDLNGKETVQKEEKEPAPAAVTQAENLVNAGTETAQAEIPRSANGNFYSPLVRSIAAEENISLEELEKLNGSGAEGRVTKSDILSYLEQRQASPSVAQTSPAEAKEKPVAKKLEPKSTAPSPGKPEAAPKATPVASMAGDEIVEMDRMRKMIADHMVHSKRTSPHVTSFVEADVTNLFKWREKVKKEFQEKEGEKITFTPIFIEALAKTIKDYPNINIAVDGQKIIQRKNINIGMAAALPSGNLIVPVIKNADQLNLVGLTKVVNDLARRARENKLSPDEIQGGTYTLTNVGTFGNVMGTPIINQPQVAIMAAGSINKKPAVIETPDGDLIGIRYKMFLSHSYDHRVVDGALGGMFVRRLADYLEQFDPNREI
jgi:2-oxoglutarate dehydrogenase E2 component (dihydrolipoamide succinyltransferase)